VGIHRTASSVASWHPNVHVRHPRFVANVSVIEALGILVDLKK
jgi:hypothetical protein